MATKKAATDGKKKKEASEKLPKAKKDVQDALIHAERRYREQRMSEHNGLGLAKALEPKSEEYRKKKLAREYIIIKLFETKELPDLIKLIKVDQFKK